MIGGVKGVKPKRDEAVAEKWLKIQIISAAIPKVEGTAFTLLSDF